MKFSIKDFFNTLFVSNLGGGQIANFGEKNPQVHLIIKTEWPKNNPPYFKKSWSFSPWYILFDPLQLGAKE